MLGKYLSLEVNNVMLRFEIHNVIVEHLVGMRENGEKLKYKKNQIKRNRGKTLIK